MWHKKVPSTSGSSVVRLIMFKLAAFLNILFLSVIFSTLSASDAIEEVATIATRIETSIEELPASISLIDEKELQLVSPIHIQQVLSRVPGVNIQRGNGQESLPSIRSPVLTGAGACGSFLILEEAIPVRGFGFCNVNELFDTHYEQAQRIEVVRGANSAFYGSNALNGSVNIVLPYYSESDLLSLEVGSFGFARLKTALGYGKQRDNNRGRFYITLANDNGYRDDEDYNQQKISWRHYLQSGKWEFQPGFTYTRLDQETAGFIVGLNSYLSEELSLQNLDPEAFRQTESLRLWVKSSKDINDNSVLEVTPYFRYTDMDFLLHFLPGDPLEQNSQTGFGWQSAVRINSSDSLNWAVGNDFEYSRGELLQTQDSPTQGSAFLQETIPTGVHYDYNVDALQVALFAHANWRFAEQWLLLAGLRWEYNQYDYDNLSLSGRTRDDGSVCGFGGCRYNRPADREDSFSQISPKIELKYFVNDNVDVFISYKNAFRAPQATELYRLQGNQNVANIDSVQLDSVDIGGNWHIANSDLELVLYSNSVRNAIIRDSDSFNVDGTRTRSRGLEAKWFYGFAPHWSFNLTANWARHQYDSEQFSGGIDINGLDVDTAPRLFGNAQLQWSSEQWLAELELVYTDSYFLNPENTSEYPGHTLLNARVNYSANDNWSFALRLTNLTDKRYAERADFTTFTDERYFPGRPLSVSVQADYRF